jgi:hypothetical protein
MRSIVALALLAASSAFPAAAQPFVLSDDQADRVVAGLQIFPGGFPIYRGEQSRAPLGLSADPSGFPLYRKAGSRAVGNLSRPFFPDGINENRNGSR